MRICIDILLVCVLSLCLTYRHVLKRAATTGEELSSMCEQGVTIDKALEFLQALASAPDEDEAGEEEEQEQAQESKGGAAASKAVRGGRRSCRCLSSNPYTCAVLLSLCVL